jgi:PHD/YefM family antitoxin component YafN of YafNO toxin-antitoxin module
MITVSDKFGTITLPTPHQGRNEMDDMAAGEKVTISREEYEAWKAGQPATVTIEAAEYKRLQEAARGVDPETHRRVAARLAEVEQLLRVEMAEHQAEVETWKKSR